MLSIRRSSAVFSGAYADFYHKSCVERPKLKRKRCQVNKVSGQDILVPMRILTAANKIIPNISLDTAPTPMFSDAQMHTKYVLNL